MGCDISILSKHNLNITNVETLAIDLADRLNFNIDYGYYAHKAYNDLLGNDFNEDFIQLGSIKKNNIEARYLLVDENYQNKQLYEKFGDKLFDLKEYWHWYPEDEEPDENKINDEKRDLALAYFSLSSVPDQYEYLAIHDDIFSNDLFNYTRWWDFCRTFQKREYLDRDYYQNYRASIMKSTLALGGNKAYFVNDQCKHLEGVGQGEEMYYNWNNLEQFINSRKTLEVVSISKTILDKEYQIEVSQKNIEDLAFMDDFNDLIEPHQGFKP